MGIEAAFNIEKHMMIETLERQRLKPEARSWVDILLSNRMKRTGRFELPAYSTVFRTKVVAIMNYCQIIEET